jgi:hypothetical protein
MNAKDQERAGGLLMDKEKYNRYLCSPEWNFKKEAVKLRSGGICERCGTYKSEAVHHLTYARLYNELLEDLQDICGHCHNFISGKSKFNPCEEMVLQQKIKNMFHPNENYIRCPICRNNNVHIKDNEMFCENDHSWRFLLETRKGMTFINITNKLSN